MYKIELTPDEVVLIGVGLDLLPHGKVSTLVRKVQEQINAQDAAAALTATLTPPNPPKRKPSRSSKFREAHEQAAPLEAATPDFFINGGTAVSQGA